MSDNDSVNGQLLLPVCVQSENEISQIVSALDMWRILSNGGAMYDGFVRVLDALQYVGNPNNSPCIDSEVSSHGACYRFDMTSDVWELYPNNPYDSTDDRKTALGMSWRTFGDIVEDSTPQWLQSAIEALDERVGYFPTDLFIDYTIEDNTLGTAYAQLQAFYDAIRLQDFAPFPRAHMTFDGTGQVEIEFCQAPFGGSVIITWDFQPELNDIMDIVQGQANSLDNFEIVELDRDLFQLPLELVSTVIWEHEFDTDEVHNIWCYFVPSASLEPPFLRPFMGIREAEFCGQIKVISADGTKEYDQTNYKNSIRQDIIKMTLSYEQFLEAVRQGNNLSKEDMAQRILLSGDTDNILSGISIDKDTGVISKNNTVAVNKVVGATFEEERFGGAYRQARGIANLLDEANQLKANGFVPATIANISRLVINPLNTITWNALITDYFNSGESISINVEALARKMYCDSAGTAIARYAIEQGHTENEIDYLSQFVSEIPATKFAEWYTEGQNTPRDGYQSSECYRLPDVFTDEVETSLNIIPLTDWNFTENRLIRLELTGNKMIQNTPDTSIDYFWKKQANGNILRSALSTDMDFQINHAVGSGKFIVPNIATVPAYSETGDYAVSFVLPANNYDVVVHGIYVGENTSPMTIKLIDLGQA